MYVMMAILMGTAWLEIGTDQVHLQDRFSALFFAVAFLAFMSVAGIPGFLEERLVFNRERANGFYRVGSYVIANTLVSIPFVFIISSSFTLVAYWLIGLNPDIYVFGRFLAFLFLALYVAESMVVFVSCLIPIFVAALTIASFMNGFFMVVQGYFVQRENLPRLWLWGHYIDYQKYAFEALLQNDLQGLTFQCQQIENVTAGQSKCFCLISNPSGPDGCSFTGQDVLNHYGYTEIKQWLWAVALIVMVIVYRVGMYLVLRTRKSRQ
jgi:ABC-type multidrug transport system permease subunit